MGQRPLTPLGLQFMAALPPVLQTSADYEACMHVLAREFERLEAAIESVRAQFNPNTADLLLGAWEAQLKLPVGGAGGTTAQRRAKVITRLQRLLGSSEGREWEQRVTEIVGMGWTYEEHIPGDATSPPAETIHIVLPFAPGLAVYAQALAEIREITPAHLDLTFASAAGFVLDASDLDLEAFAG